MQTKRQQALTVEVGMVGPVADLKEDPCNGDDSHAQPDPPLLVGQTTLTEYNIADRLAVCQLQILPAWRRKLVDGNRLLRI